MQIHNQTIFVYGRK